MTEAEMKKLKKQVQILEDCLNFMKDRLFKCGKLYEGHLKVLDETMATQGDIKKIEERIEAERTGVKRVGF